MSRPRVLLTLAALVACAVAGRSLAQPEAGGPRAGATPGRVFELRTYTANEGKLDALHARFRDHTLGLFEKHGMKNVGYWVPADGPTAANTLVYLLAHDSREAAKENWKAFGADPEWQRVRAESEKDGKLVARVDSVYLNPTDYSPMK